jgi:methylmalonyl-CoA/ethylmalonyl-CoA epimerase
VAFALNRIGQIPLSVADVDRAEALYRDVLGLRQLYRHGDLSFFNYGGVRSLIEKASDPNNISQGSPIYFDCHDMALAVGELPTGGVCSDGPPHLIDHD